MTKKVKITEEYVEDFIRADNTFKYQLVFCPKQRKLVPLTPYEKDIKTEELEYAGNHFDESLGQDFAFNYAIGNVDTKTLKIVDSYSFEPKYDSIWSENWISYKKNFTKNPIVLQKLDQNKVLTVSEDNNRHSKRNSQSIEETQHSQYFNKRLKVDENHSLNTSKLFNEYSAQIIESSKTQNMTTESITHTSRNQIYSRNIFKTSDSSEDPIVQSKYFSNIQFESSSREDSFLQSNSLSGRVIGVQKSPEMSQLSLNSSGNTEIDSSLDETVIMSDTERSEISETSDEDIIAINSFTNLKPKTNGSIERLAPLNSTFISSSKNSDIRSYFTFK